MPRRSLSLGCMHAGLHPGRKEKLAAITEPDDEVIIAGDDWSAIAPYFAGRRALMIRRGIESNLDALRPIFRAQQGEPVMALVLHGDQQQNQALLAEINRQFRIDPRPVAFTAGASLHVHEQLYGDLQTILALRRTPGVRIAPGAEATVSWLADREIPMSALLARQQARFARFSPQPWKFHSALAAERVTQEGDEFLTAYAGSKYWFRVAAGGHTLSIETMLLPGAYADSVPWGDRSDGIELIVTVPANGETRQLVCRHINPRDNPADRGLKTLELPFTLETEAEVELAISPGPQGNGARDWNLLRAVRIK